MNNRSYLKTVLKKESAMKKTYKIDVDCANCANKMEQAANCKKVEDDCEIFL